MIRISGPFLHCTAIGSVIRRIAFKDAAAALAKCETFAVRRTSIIVAVVPNHKARPVIATNKPCQLVLVSKTDSID